MSTNSPMERVETASSLQWVETDSAINMYGPYLSNFAVCPVCGVRNLFRYMESMSSPVKCEEGCEHLREREFREEGTNWYGFEGEPTQIVGLIKLEKSMSDPPAGYYRKLLPVELEHVRLARSDKPMNGVIVLDCAERLAIHFETLTDPHAANYAQRLRSGAILPVVPQSEKVWGPGELFFRS